MDKGAVRRRGCGRLRPRPLGTAGDRGYSSPPARSRLKQYRLIATRYEQRAINYLAMVTPGMTMLWLA